MNKKQITIYSTPTCHFCHAAKDYFNEKEIEFTEKDVSTDLQARQEMIEKSGQMGVPQILIGDQLIVGFDQGKIEELLNSEDKGDAEETDKEDEKKEEE